MLTERAPCEEILVAKLRPANQDGAAGALEEIERVISQIRERWPDVSIVVRGDSGFCRDNLMTWCKDNRVDYVFGLAQNFRLVEMLGPELLEAARESKATGKAARRFKDFDYRTKDSWTHERRVIGKAEWAPPSAAELVAKSETETNQRKKRSIMVGDVDLATFDGRANPRFVVTSLSREEFNAQDLYEKEYCARGEMENRIKECQLDLFSDRTSAHSMHSNQLRLWFSALAYVLVNAVRRIALAGTRLANATCGSIRLKLLKIGAQVKTTVRRIKISMAETFPYADVFAAACAALSQAAR